MALAATCHSVDGWQWQLVNAAKVSLSACTVQSVSSTSAPACNVFSMSRGSTLSILAAIFPVEPRLDGFIEAKDDGNVGDSWSYKMCKAPVKSSPPTNQHAMFYKPDAISVAQPTVLEHNWCVYMPQYMMWWCGCSAEYAGVEDCSSEVHGKPTPARSVCDSATGCFICWELGRRLRLHRPLQVSTTCTQYRLLRTGIFIHFENIKHSNHASLQCFDTVGWVTGRVSGL